MTNKPSREDVLKIAGEPVAKASVGDNTFFVRAKPAQLEKLGFNLAEYLEIGLYTEAQLLAMYAAGAEGMRERVGVLLEGTFAHTFGRHITDSIRALPITTNTEGEQR